MEEVNVIIISSDDGEWEGMYVDGYLFEEGHRLSNRDWMDLINKNKYFISAEQKWIDGINLEDLGASFPFRLSEIPEEYIRNE